MKKIYENPALTHFEEDEPSSSLMHYGKLGMKWGHRQLKSYAKEHKQQIKKANKEAKAKDIAKAKSDQAKRVDSARKLVSSGKAKSDYKTAKATYKVEKYTKGKYIAKKALAKASKKYTDTLNTASEARDGKEFVGNMIKGTLMNVAINQVVKNA